MNKGIIIGGGIAGLSAGIHAQLAGYQTEIYEKNLMLGGECSGWVRQGYNIDNCIHWITGCNTQDKIYSMWEDLGVLGENVELIREPYFYRLVLDGKVLTLWRDCDRAEKEFLTIAPEDEEQIKMFFDAVRSAQCLQIPCEKSIAEMNFIEYIKFGMQMAPMGKAMKEYGKENVLEFANRFNNPYIKAVLSCYFNQNFAVMAMLSSYSFYASGTGAIPVGGSVGMVERMKQRYESLGGVIHTAMSAEKICIDKKTAKSVIFQNGETVDCDFVICATDTTITFGKLLDENYMDKKLRIMYENRKKYPVSSGYNVSFGIIGDDDYGLGTGSTIFKCDPYRIGRITKDMLGIRVYDYDDTLFSKSKRVIQTNFLQDEDDYAYWEKLYEDRQAYEAQKTQIAEDIKDRIIKEYPTLEGKLIILCSYSPMTFTKWCGAFHGAYMSFIGADNAKSIYVKNTIKGLKNVFVSSQWLQLNGGLPLAATSGKFVVDAMKKRLVTH